MIRVRTLGGLQPREPVAGEVVLLEDAHGNPFFVAYATQPGQITCVAASDPAFQKTLRQLGLDKVAVTYDALQLPGPPAGARPLIIPTGALT